MSDGRIKKRPGTFQILAKMVEHSAKRNKSDVLQEDVGFLIAFDIIFNGNNCYVFANDPYS